MTFSTSPTRYARISILLHWLMVVLFVGVYASIELRVLFDRGTDLREALKSLHFMLGLGILLLVFIRIVARILTKVPPIIPKPNIIQHAAALIVHFALYMFMIAMPLMGWLILSARGLDIPFFGLELPALMGVNNKLGGDIKEWHETIGELGYYLIALHAAAALFNHYILKDNTIKRMWFSK